MEKHLKHLGSTLDAQSLVRPQLLQGAAPLPMDPELDAPLCSPIVPEPAVLRAVFPAAVGAGAAGAGAAPARVAGPSVWWPSCMLVDKAKVKKGRTGRFVHHLLFLSAMQTPCCMHAVHA
jgi:hypothetical protein